MNKQVNITITAGPNMGKTTIARIIEEALRTNGFVDVEVSDLPQSDGPKEPVAQRFEVAKKRPVRIKVEPLSRSSREEVTLPAIPSKVDSRG